MIKPDRVIVILGASGQLGSELALACTRWGWTVKPFGHREIEIADGAAVGYLIAAERPWAVLNCTAYNQVNGAEVTPAEAFAINGAAAASLARACREADSILVHFSTDYVFDGSLGRPYLEDDAPAPLNIYGLSKLAGEMAVRILQPRHCLIRLTGLYGVHRSPKGKPNFVESILAKAHGGGTFSVHSDLICTPTSARQAAEAVCELLDREALGTFHLTNSGFCSWFEFANEIVRQASISCDIIPAPYSSGVGRVKRPKFTALSNAKIQSVGIRSLPAWQEAVADYLRTRTL